MFIDQRFLPADGAVGGVVAGGDPVDVRMVLSDSAACTSRSTSVSESLRIWW